MWLITSLQELKKALVERLHTTLVSCLHKTIIYLYVCLGRLLQVNGSQSYLDFELTGSGGGALPHG